jgi:hypothetical protein
VLRPSTIGSGGPLVGGLVKNERRVITMSEGRREKMTGARHRSILLKASLPLLNLCKLNQLPSESWSYDLFSCSYSPLFAVAEYLLDVYLTVLLLSLLRFLMFRAPPVRDLVRERPV